MERSNGTAKHRQRNTGMRVLNALYYARQPNRKFERDPNASHPGPSTLALAFLRAVSIGLVFWLGFVLLKLQRPSLFARHNMRVRHIGPRLLPLSFKQLASSQARR